MNYHQYYSLDVLNGEGTRCTLFVAGCEHQCKGCYNQSTWSVNSGHLFNQELEDKIISDLNDTRIVRRGLSLSGGDPLHPANVSSILSLLTRIQSECKGKDIWLWTGYKLEQLNDKQRDVLCFVDVLIDGKFEKSLADPGLVWRGSLNQNVHRFKRNKEGII